MKKINLIIENKKMSLDFNEHFGNLVRINESLNFGASQNYQKRGMVYVDVPEIVGITGACENVDTLFKIGNHSDLPLFFTQTGQLSLEQALQSFSGVWTVIHSGRDEEKEDERHLRQFRLTEEEFDSSTIGMTRENYNEDKMYEALLINIQKTIQSMIKGVLENNEKTLKTVYKRDLEKLYFALENDFLKITYEDCVKLLSKNGFPNISFGDDLKSKHEAKVVKLLNKNNTELPVFIMKYPKEIKFFNMKVSASDPRVCLSADLIFPYAGEGTGASVREHDFEKLRDRLMTSTMYNLHLKRGGKYEDFKWYLDIMEKEATDPHAGYGIGNDRVLQYIFGEQDIRNTSLFSLFNSQTGDWAKERYGQAGVLTSNKKRLLLSVGKQKNKQMLLPYIKHAVNENVIFYATQKTHQFLKQHGITTLLVHKISEIGSAPNISDLLEQRVFDTIINIPTNEEFTESKEFTDGKLIRKGAIAMGTSLITNVEVAAMVLGNLRK
ncbi:MAG: amino acid--tRNA ligase-related protein [Candidatus Levyibacteriota bacterium]|jgi:asparaginyl-tRNA synthetase